jgi:hypothetical protein
MKPDSVKVPTKERRSYVPFAAKRVIILYMKTQITCALAVAVIFNWPIPATAEYTLILKNGRQITVQSYREENGVIKFGGLGGEIGISKDQIQTIRSGASGTPADLDLTRETLMKPAAVNSSVEEGSAAKAPTQDDERLREEKEYQNKLNALNEQLKAAQDRYSESIRGTAGAEPTQLVTEEQIKARQDDAVARFKDAQNHPSEPAPVKLLTPSPFTSLPPTVTEVQPSGRLASPFEAPQTLTDRQKELLELRNQAVEIENQRERLINEMRQKNFYTGPTNP